LSIPITFFINSFLQFLLASLGARWHALCNYLLIGDLTEWLFGFTVQRVTTLSFSCVQSELETPNTENNYRCRPLHQPHSLHSGGIPSKLPAGAIIETFLEKFTLWRR